MSKWTDYGENRLIDKIRGTEPTYAANWYIALGSVGDDGTFTEITGADLPRVAVARSAAKWAATNGSGTTISPSSGSSRSTSNNDAISFSAAASNRGSAEVVALFDASTGGNRWAYAPMPGGAVTVNMGDAPVIAAGALAFAISAQGLTNYGANKLIDEFFRGVAYAWPASLFGALFTTGGSEVAGGSYARAQLDSSPTVLSSTQGNTSASTGTGGASQNLVAINFPTPTVDWGDVNAAGFYDASSGGNELWHKSLSTKTISAGGAPGWPVGELEFVFA